MLLNVFFTLPIYFIPMSASLLPSAVITCSGEEKLITFSYTTGTTFTKIFIDSLAFALLIILAEHGTARPLTTICPTGVIYYLSHMGHG